MGKAAKIKGYLKDYGFTYTIKKVYNRYIIKYIKEELGDLLFSIVNLARFLHIDSEEALNLTNQKFINRFEFMEENASKLHKKLEDLTLDQMEELWQSAKKNKL